MIAARYAKALIAFVTALLILLNADPTLIANVSANLEAIIAALGIGGIVAAVPNREVP